jgi:hypothetical protein
VPDRDPVTQINARVVNAEIRNPAGNPVHSVEQGMPIVVDIWLEAARLLDAAQLTFQVVNEDGTVVFGFSKALDQPVPAGGRFRIAGQIENRLVAGRHYLDCWIRQDEQELIMGLQCIRLLSFVVYGTAPRHGVVVLETDVEASVE